MHERALVTAAATELAALVGEHRVGRVTLALSPETSPGVVEEAWRSAASDTPVAEAALDWVVAEHVLQCLDCGVRYQGHKLTVCPACGGNGLIVEASPEVAVVSWMARGAV